MTPLTLTAGRTALDAGQAMQCYAAPLVSCVLFPILFPVSL